jgi:hypothetical protein
MNVAVLMPSSLHMSGTEIPDSTRLSASMIWLSVNGDFFISADSFRWKKFYSQPFGFSGGLPWQVSGRALRLLIHIYVQM